MSTKYTGGFITKSPVAPTTTAASGIWTLDQQQQAQKAGTWPSPPIFIEDLFSTYLYTGNGSTQTITNGIDLSGKGGLVWTKVRNQSYDHVLVDTVRGANNELYSNTTGAQFNASSAGSVSGFSSTGYSLDYFGGSFRVNKSPETYASWTFRKAPKFFDVVTYSGSNSTQTISHNLGSTPGCIIIKKLDSNLFNAGWAVYHRSLTNPNNYYLTLNSTDAETNYGGAFISSVNSTTFTVAGGAGQISIAGSTYVAYLFAHDAGGFPVSGGGSTNGITCGSWTGTGSTFNVDLGYEPQWLMFKRTDDLGDWVIVDNMRGFTTTGADAYLKPNTNGAETSVTGAPAVNATGFSWNTSAGSTFIYIAIRRGPMKTPTVGTSVFLPSTAPATTPFNVGFPPDLALWSVRDSTGNKEASTRLQGGAELFINTTAAESSGLDIGWASKTNFWYQNVSGGSIINWLFRRAPGFCDVVCYTGVGGIATFNHNLTVTPELLIIKRRSASSDWPVLYNFVGSTFNKLYLNLTSSAATNTYTDGAGLGGAPTATTFTVDGTSTFNGAGSTFVAYLFASCPGVSKVGSYTGNGTTQTINCGFTGGARFVLIKQTDASGGWYTYDTARGMTVSTNPYLRINNIAAEIATLGSVTTVSTGFALDSNILPDINFNAGTYIFLAIA